MSAFDITLAVTAQSETVVAGPTMRSAEFAIRAAEAEGFRVERLIGLDAPSDDCRAFFSQPRFGEWKTVELEMRELGRTRNALAELAAGRWIAFLDADDLFSENWLAAAARRLVQAEQEGGRAIVHPELNWFFDGAAHTLCKTEQDDPLFAPQYFYFSNYYDSLCMAPRSAVLEIPYTTRDLNDGFGYQDWQWNIETMAAGWRHVVARDTVIFKRRRDDSLVVQNHHRQAMIRAVEPMAIDRVSRLAMGAALEGHSWAMTASASAPIAARSASPSGAE
jgi:hypothetical protein